eukprot:6573843-Pyramimonas_sp.AAC.1
MPPTIDRDLQFDLAARSGSDNLCGTVTAATWTGWPLRAREEANLCKMLAWATQSRTPFDDRDREMGEVDGEVDLDR